MTADLRIIDQTSTESSLSIDPRAAVHPGAKLGPGCRVEPFAVIGEHVVLGADCVVHSHAVVSGPVCMGDGNEIYSHACIGGAPQDLRHRGEPTTLEIGDRNTFREFVTVGRGTVHGGGITRIGNDNLIMAYSHVAHDCRIGNRAVLANHATLAGHVVVGDYVVFGGMVAVASFVRIGESAMLAAGSMIERDVPPFCTVSGNRAQLRGVNLVGLRRRGICDEAITQIKQLVRDLKLPGTSFASVVAGYSRRSDLTAEALRLISFLQQIKGDVSP